MGRIHQEGQSLKKVTTLSTALLLTSLKKVV